MEYQRQRKRPEPAAPAPWGAERLRALRRHLGLSQRALAGALGMRQQTISEWETSLYRPRGASARLLSLIAEEAGFAYDASSEGTAREASAPDSVTELEQSKRQTTGDDGPPAPREGAGG